MNEAPLVVWVASLALSCSSGATEPSAPGAGGPLGERLVTPEGLSVTERPGGCGGLEVTALTLNSGPNGVELYAALRNRGASPACSASFSVELFDASERSVAAGVGGLSTKRFFRLADGSDNTAACLWPGDVTMLALRELNEELLPSDVSRVDFWCNYWALDVVPTGSLVVSEVVSVAAGDHARLTGTLTNDLDVPLPTPAVAVFPLSQEGRPLGVAFAESTTALPPGGAWRFETNVFEDPGARALAFPTRGP